MFGQIVALPAVLVSCTAALETMIASGGGIVSSDHVLGAKAWVYSMCISIGLWRSRNKVDGEHITAARARSTVQCLLRVLETGAPVPPPGSADLTEEEKLSRGCTDAIAGLSCALCASDMAIVGKAVLDDFVNQLSRPDTDNSSWVARAIAVMQVLKTVSLMFVSSAPDQTTRDDKTLANSGVQMVLMHVIGPVIDLANMDIANSSSAIQEIPHNQPDQAVASMDTENDQQPLLLRPAALQLVFSIVLQLKSDVLKGERRAQIFDVCEAACCADDENCRLRGAQLAGAIM